MKYLTKNTKTTAETSPLPKKIDQKKSLKKMASEVQTVSFGVELAQINVTFCLYDVNFFSLSTSGSEMNCVAFGKEKINMFLTK